MAGSGATTLGEKILLFAILIIAIILTLTGLGFFYTQKLIDAMGDQGALKSHGALVVYEKKEEFVCNVNLITSTWALTSGRCVKIMEMANSSANLWFVRAGTEHWSHPGSRRLVQNFVLHPEFNREPLDFNIGLIEVKEPFDEIYIMDWDNVGAESGLKGGLVAGWHKPFYSILMVEDEFTRKSVEMLDDETCQTQLGELGVYTNASICVTSHKDHTCYPGDGYGFIQRGKLVGIRSWGEACIDDVGPQVLTLVNPFMDWVKDIVKK